ncbi:MAG: 4'-phosphopantetheinyl transferase superfamily protein [Candidatus Dadabacteria bacterium]|nr:MAG: 4'-phosphopantetheinyl transferase superfamily protein [Candidatus Dadabacteria bacterium]
MRLERTHRIACWWLRDVCRDSTGAGDGAAPELGTYLSPDEKRRAGTMRRKRRRSEFTAGRALARLAVAEYCGCKPQEVIIASDRNGRPLVRAPGHDCGLRIGITHSMGIAACAVAPVERLGIDVEVVRALPRLEAVARRCFGEAELRDFGDLSDAERRGRFFALWTLKEAYAKAVGIGLALGLHRVQFFFDQGAIVPAFAPELREHGRAWQFTLTRPAPDFFLALAVRKERGDEAPVHIAEGLPRCSG